MSENAPPTGAATNRDVPGQPYYEKTRQHLKELLHKRRMLARSLELQEEQIYKKETEYLEETPSGNTKGTSSAVGGARKRGNAVDGNRVFSKSSISYNANAVRVPASKMVLVLELIIRIQESPIASAPSTPVAAMAPTPLSTSFLKGEGASNHATPTSTSSANRTGAGTKKNKKNGEDSETDTKDSKKIRTNFGVTRK
jgi:chromatin modification-related protein EAF6